MRGLYDFIQHHFRHFSGAALVDATQAYSRHVDGGGQMLVTLAGANLEEDIFNLVAHDHYVRIPHYRHLSPEQEEELLDQHLNRVTDTCIPEFEAIRRIEGAVLDEWTRADKASQRYFPHEFMYKILRSGVLEEHYQIDPKDSCSPRANAICRCSCRAGRIRP